MGEVEDKIHRRILPSTFPEGKKKDGGWIERERESVFEKGALST